MHTSCSSPRPRWLFWKRTANVGVLYHPRRNCPRPGRRWESSRFSQDEAVNEKTKQLTVVRQVRASILIRIAVHPRIRDSPFAILALQADADSNQLPLGESRDFKHDVSVHKIPNMHSPHI